MKPKRYWLRGVIWFEGLWLGLWLLWAFLGLYSGHSDEIFSNANDSYYHDALPAFLMVSIIAIISGAVMGWLYGKFRKPELIYESNNLNATRTFHKRYWLRGGVTTVILFLGGILIILSSFRLPFSGGGGTLQGDSTLGSKLLVAYIIAGFPMITVAFGIGALLGWLYGKLMK